MLPWKLEQAPRQEGLPVGDVRKRVVAAVIGCRLLGGSGGGRPVVVAVADVGGHVATAAATTAAAHGHGGVDGAG